MSWNWLSFFSGALAGWLVEWLIDYIFWRRRHRALLDTQAKLESQLDNARAVNQQLEAQVTLGESKLRASKGERDALQTEIEALTEKLSERENQSLDCKASLRTKADELEATASQLAQVQATVKDLRAQMTEQAQRTVACQETLAAKESELATLAEDLAAAKAALEADKVEHVDVESRAQALDVSLESPPAVAPIVIEPEDLRKIEGIGPKIAEILSGSGILTFAQLANTSVDALRAILRDAGPRFRIANPSSWPDQARLAAEGKWEELQQLQDRLTGGRISDGPKLTQ